MKGTRGARFSPSVRDAMAASIPLLGAPIALALGAGAAGASPGLWPLAPLALAVAFGAAHRPLGPGTLGLGALALPLLAHRFPPAVAASAAAAALFAAEFARRKLKRQPGSFMQERRRTLRALQSSGRAAIAVLLAALAFGAAASRRPLAVADPLSLFAAALAGLLVYVLTWIGLESLDRVLRRPALAVQFGPILKPLAVDALAWSGGTVLLAVALATGPALGMSAVLLAALLALDAAREGLAAELSKQKVEDLERIGIAGRRMFGAAKEAGEAPLLAVVRSIANETSRVLDYGWFQFEIAPLGAAAKSWWSRGGSSGVFEGEPEPEEHPPALLGFHRRRPWKIVDHRFETPRASVVHLKLWCDARRVEAQATELLERLLPQMATSLEHALLDREAREDPLTGVAVRRILERRLQEAYARTLDRGASMAVVLCDLDHFKKINDTWGHDVGDRALVSAATMLEAHRREGDLCARYGGEEFALLLEEASGSAALALAERLREQVESIELIVDGKRIPITMSVGVAAFPELHVKAPGELLVFADEALYEAKHRGRNRCLLNLGQGRYRAIDGEVVSSADTRPGTEAPRIFA